MSRDKQTERGFLDSKAARILTAALVIQAGLLYGFTRSEYKPVIRPLSEVPAYFGSWQLVQEGVIEQEVRDVLRADDLLNRTYANVGTRLGAHLFVAFFRSQRTGQAPHSPKNCLPGNGWVWQVSDEIPLAVPNRAPVTINRYIIAKGDARSVVLYWYQSRDRVVASEYAAKFFVVADAMRYNRTDTSLIRITVPVAGKNDAEAMKTATDFAAAAFPVLSSHLPN